MPLAPVRFLLPGTTGRSRCGGLLVELQTARLVSRIAPVQVVTYRQREPEHPFLEDLLRREAPPGDGLWIVSWGFDVPALLRRLCPDALSWRWSMVTLWSANSPTKTPNGGYSHPAVVQQCA